MRIFLEVEKFVVDNASIQWLGRKLFEREAITLAFVAKAIYGYPFNSGAMVLQAFSELAKRRFEFALPYN